MIGGFEVMVTRNDVLLVQQADLEEEWLNTGLAVSYGYSFDSMDT